MKTLVIMAALGLGACQAVAPETPPPPAAVAVETNADVARVLAGLRQRGLPVVRRDVSKVEALKEGPGYAYGIGKEWLHLHAYPDAAAASRARARFAEKTPHAVISWIGRPNIFQCGTAVALYLGEAPAPLAALTQMCGAGSQPR